MNLQAKFTLVIGTGLLALALSAAAAVSYFEYSGLEQKLKLSSQNEVNSLNSLVKSAMALRFEDPQNVAIKVFDGWFESRNHEQNSKLWAVWGQGIVSYMAKTDPKHTAKLPHDAIDEEVLRTGQPVGRFVGDTYRYSIPIVEGSPLMKQPNCISCHGAAMGTKDGEVIAVFSSSRLAGDDFVALRQRVIVVAAGAVAAILIMLAAVWLVFGHVVAQPISKIARVLTELTNDRVVDVPFATRGDEVGAIAKATEVFKHSIAEKVINLRVRTGLDAVRSNILVADQDYNVMYMNPALQGMLREAEPELRKALPQFDSSKLIGANMDFFHKDPPHQRQILDSLTGTHESFFTIGTQHFHHIVTPVIDKHGKRVRHGRRMAERNRRKGDRNRDRRHREGRCRWRLLQAHFARRQERVHAQSCHDDELAVRQCRGRAGRPGAHVWCAGGRRSDATHHGQLPGEFRDPEGQREYHGRADRLDHCRDQGLGDGSHQRLGGDFDQHDGPVAAHRGAGGEPGSRPRRRWKKSPAR